MRKVHSVGVAMVAALCLIVGSAPVLAQTGEGNIIGQVADESGAVIPGVAVTATSPALQVGEVSAVTDGQGEYRLARLPLGVYTVTYSLDGFSTVRREDLRLTAGFTARVDIAMKVGSLNETVTVTGASPVVDVSTTTTKTELTRETLELIPTNRNGVMGIMAQIPGVRTNLDVGGGATVFSPPQFRSLGQNSQPWPTIEGVLISAPKSDTQPGVYQDYASFEEVEVRTVANDASVPVRGLDMTMILKSGGNAFHGGTWWNYSNDKLTSNNIDAPLAAQGLRPGNPITLRFDASGDLGGRIVRDKLWFYGGYRTRKNEELSTVAFKDDGSPADGFQTQKFHTGKISYQLNQSNRFIGYYQWNTKNNISPPGRFQSYDSRQEVDQRGLTDKVEWQATFGQATAASFQWGFWDWRAIDSGFSTQPSRVDIRLVTTTGENIFLPSVDPGEWRHHARGSVSFYKSEWAGNHMFKTGFDYMRPVINWRYHPRQSGDYQLRYDNNVPFQVVVLNRPALPVTTAHYTGIYLSDAWAIRRRLTLNLGLRYAHDNLFVPEQSRSAGRFAAAETFPKVQFAIWDSVAPRVHLAFDVLGDGRTVIKGGWGRFDHMRGVDEGEPSNKNSHTRTTYTWRDLNRNNDYDDGETNLDPNGPDFVSVVSGNGSGGEPPGNRLVNLDEKQPKVDEFSIALERELIPNFAVRVSGIYTREFNVPRLLDTGRPHSAYNIAITRPDPGLDGVVGNADDTGQSLTYYEYPVSLRGLRFQVPMIINDPNADRKTKTIEVATTKRLANRWLFMASYSATHVDDPFLGNAGGGQDFRVNTVDPNSEIFSTIDNWEWLGKVSGAYQLPLDMLVSASFEHRSGDTYARTVLLRGGVTIPSFVVRTEAIGARRYDHINRLDFRFEKGFRFRTGQKLTARVDTFNLLNTNVVTSSVIQSGATFGLPNAVVPSRNVQISASYTF